MCETSEVPTRSGQQQKTMISPIRLPFFFLEDLIAGTRYCKSVLGTLFLEVFMVFNCTSKVACSSCSVSKVVVTRHLDNNQKMARSSDGD